ncbi:TIR domain-containing protein [Spirosoma sp. HMF4905]|uniref:TIR domain-containing protein n=1 Tax=Spirosoma arboris TaxID=2682092 RepID=A0A7K1SQR3_9BACT|nr:COR domain-containing protein [Spirosoma arboris]MVM35936.1 TIR domain-containing protein [Spirosoma arboris]
MTPSLALDLINKAYEEKATFLDLGNCGLTEIPEEITKLAPFLRELNLGHDYFKDNKYTDSENKGAKNNFSRDDIKVSAFQKLQLTGLFLSRTYLSAKHILLITQYQPRLVFLDISSNKLTAVESQNIIQQLSKLTSLEISDNQLTDIEAQYIAQFLPQLTSLAIWGNQLTEKGAKYIAQLSNLTSLQIWGNNLTDTGAQYLAQLQHLISLDISYNNLTDTGAQHLAQLSNLTSLQIWGNNLTDTGAQYLAQLQHLTSLDISNNKLTDTGAQHLAQLSNLTSLTISYNKLTATGAQHLAQLSNLTSLTISYNKLTDTGAQHLAQLSNLTSLTISSNNLTATGAQHLAQLSNLTSLTISNNNLTDTGAQHLAQLSNLTLLTISSNNLTDTGAQHLAQLSNLTSLDISYNKLTATGAQRLAQLSNLTSLTISNNNLTDTGAQHLAQLSNLTSLTISNNNLTEKGIEGLVKLPRLTNLIFYGNKQDTIPESIRSDLKALRDYFQANELVDNNFVKVILMGNTTSGKSSLANYLVDGTFNNNRDSTHGIQLWKWIVDAQKPTNNLIVNIWDFGGQDYYHATHTLFLSDKTLFLFLHTDKETHTEHSQEENQYLSEAYWLANIQSLAGRGSIAWFIHSKYEPDTTENSAQRIFLNPEMTKTLVRNQFAVSVKKASENDLDAVRSFTYFRDNLITELRKLATEKLPSSWVEIRDVHLIEWRKKDRFLSKKSFWEKCKAAFVGRFALQNDFDTEPIGLLTYLSGCGEIVWFQDNVALQDQIYLSVDQLTTELFTLLTEEIKKSQGQFIVSKLTAARQKALEEYLKILLEFKLIFKKIDTDDTYVVPQYLPENPYTVHFQQLIQIAYVIRLAYLPRSLVTRFLVTYANTRGSYYWRYGAFFKRGNFHLFVQMNVTDQTVAIHINDGTGTTKEKYTILQELFQFFTLPPTSDEVYRQNSSVAMEETKRIKQAFLSGDGKKMIQLSSDGREFATIADLENAIKNKITKVKSTEGNYMTISPVMHQLLNENATTPRKIFLSYAHKDEQYKKELDTHFSALKRSGLVETWQDREIMAGEDWDKVIKDAIKQSDIVLLMLSPDFMASDYIWNIELPEAQKHNTEIIPLFIRPCDFEETQFAIYKKQGLPGYEIAQTRWIVSSEFPNRDEGYLKIVQGVRERLT